MISTFTTVFPFVYTLTRGGPGYSTYLLDYYVYDAAFFGGAFGYASAVGMVLLVIVSGVCGLVVLLLRRGRSRMSAASDHRACRRWWLALARPRRAHADEPLSLRLRHLHGLQDPTATTPPIRVGPPWQPDPRVPRARADHRQHARLPRQLADRRRDRGRAAAASSRSIAGYALSVPEIPRLGLDPRSASSASLRCPPPW